MEPLFDLSAPKKATNLSVNSDLLKKSRAKLAELGAEGWVSENRKAIRTYNEFVEQHGCFGGEFKEF